MISQFLEYYGRRNDHQIIKSSTLIFGIILSFSCESENQTTERVEKALIFIEFNVEQPRGHMAFVQSQSITDEQHRDGASAGLQSRSSGIVKALECKANQNFAENEESIGSGFLSSSTRFTTALHVVVSELHSGFVSPKPIKVHFGSAGGGLAINNYVADSGVDQGNLDYDEAYRYDAEGRFMRR